MTKIKHENHSMSARPIVPWMGGKRKLAKHILPLFPEHTCYVEAFAGGAALFFIKEPSAVEILNDSDGELVNLYRVVQHHLEEFIRHFRWSLISREMFKWAMEQNPVTLTDIQRAARFFYLQKNCFGGKPTGRTFGTAATTKPRLNLLRIEEDLSEAHIRLARVLVENLTWENCCQRYDRDETLFYLDPPYWETAGYGKPFGLDEYQKIAAFSSACKGKIIVSINDHPDMRGTFANLNLREIGISYSIGNRRSAKTKTSPELLLTNF